MTSTQAVFNGIATKFTPAAHVVDRAKTHFLLMESSPFTATVVHVYDPSLLEKSIPKF